MKKRLVGLVLLLCLVLCCTWGLAETPSSTNETAVSTDEEFLAALLDDKIQTIIVSSTAGNSTGNVTLTQDVTINRNVNILYNSIVSILGSDHTLTIAKGCTVTMGEVVGGTTNYSYLGNVYPNVVNYGLLQGSTTFRGDVTNYGDIAGSHRFYGTCENKEGSTNRSIVNVTFDFGGMIVREWEVTDGENIKYTAYADEITGTIIRGQALSGGITFTDSGTWVNGAKTDDALFLTAEREGLTLDYWTKSDGNTLTSADAPEDELTVYANWSTIAGSETYTLSYHPNGGTGDVKSFSFAAGERLKVESNLFESMRDQYDQTANFLGWNTKADGTGYAYDEGDLVTFGSADVDLYAQWTRTGFPTEVTFSVSYHNNNSDTNDILDTDGSLSHDQSPREVKSHTDFRNMITPTDKVFAGWSFNREGTGTILQAGDKVTLVDGGGEGPGVHLFAVWKDACTVTFDDGFGTKTTTTVAKGARVAEPAKPTHQYFTFQHWSKQGETAAFDFTTAISGDITLVAQWDAIPVSKEQELRDAVASNPGKPIRMTETFNLTSDLDIDGDVTIDMNGNDLGCQEGVGINVSQTGKLTIQNSGSVRQELSSFNPPILNQGTLALDGFIYFNNVSLMGSGTLQHTPFMNEYPYMNDVSVENIVQLEKVLGLAGGTKNHVYNVFLSKDIALKNDVTLPKDVFLYLNGHTLSGNATLTLAEGSTLCDYYDSESSGARLGSVTCGLIIDDGARVSSELYVDVDFETGTWLFRPEGQSVIRGQKATKPADPPKDVGMTLLRWNNGDKEFDFDTRLTEDVTLTAEWDAILVGTEEQLRAAVTGNSGKTIRLEASFDLTQDLNITGNVTIDLDGWSLMEDGGRVVIASGGKLTIKNHDSGNDNQAYFDAAIINQGTLAVEEYVKVSELHLIGSGKMEHTPYGNGFPWLSVVYVESYDQLESMLSLADGTTNHVEDIYMAGDIELKGNVTIPTEVRLRLDGHTLSGDDYTLTLAEDSSLTDNAPESSGAQLGSVTCGSVINEGAYVPGFLEVYVFFETETELFAPEPQKIIRGQKAVEPTAPTDIGMTLQGWSRDGEAFDFGTHLYDEIVTLTAEWDAVLVNNVEELRDAASSQSGKPIRLGSSFELTGGMQIGSDCNVTIDLNGYQLTYDGDCGITVMPDATLTLLNSQSDNLMWACVYPPIIVEGKLAVEGYVTIDSVHLINDGTVQHTPYDDSYPVLYTVYVNDTATLENALSLADGTKNYVINVVLIASFDLKADVTIPQDVSLYLYGATLFGDKTLTLAEGSVVQNSMDPDDPLGSVTCNLVDNGAYIDSALLCKVTFNGEAVTAEPQYVLRGQPVSKPGDPTNPGHTFTGWSDGETIWDFSTEITDNLNLTACWDLDTCTVTLDYGDKIATKEVAYGDTFYTNVIPSKDGYVFTGWYLEGRLYDLETPITQDITLEAQWVSIMEQFDLAVGQTYYFDLSSLTIPGTANTAIPDATLHYVPFVYLGSTKSYRLTADTIPDVVYAEMNAVSHSLFMSRYNLTHTVSWNQLNQAGLIFAKDYSFANVPYQLRVASGGTTNTAVQGLSEWSMYYKKDYQVMGKFESAYSWAQDATQYGHVFRGSHATINGSSAPTDFTNEDLGYRPVLEAPAYTTSSSIKAVTLDLNGGSLGDQTSILIAVHENGFNAPTNEGLTGPEGKTFVGWLADNAKVYAVGEAVPGTCAKLTAQWQSADAPIITGLVDGKTYCGSVTFTVSTDDAHALGNVHVTVNGTALMPNAKGIYTLQPASGTQKVVATNAAGAAVQVTVTVNDSHSWGTWSANGDGTHTRVCTISGCAEAEKESCSGGTATCTDKALCTVCGAPYGTVNASVHAGLTHVPAKASTTTETGNSEYWHCEHCGKYFADAAATKEIAKADTILPLQPEVPKTGDPAPLALWACLMLLGIGGLAVMRKRIHS